MKLQVVATYDAKSQLFGQPAYFQTKGVAIRSFGDQVEKDPTISKHPEDFSLFHLAEYDDGTGLHVPLTAPVQISTAIDHIEEPQ